ncbi:MAG: SPFH domain-containing protein, partial [Thermoleophilia bacterium]
MAVAGILIGIIGVIVLLLLLSAIRIAKEYERGVIFRLGRVIGTKGPGLFLLIPVVDRMVKIDLRIVTMSVPPQEVITRDNVPVRVNAVLFFRVIDARNAVVTVENFIMA